MFEILMPPSGFRAMTNKDCLDCGIVKVSRKSDDIVIEIEPLSIHQYNGYITAKNPNTTKPCDCEGFRKAKIDCKHVASADRCKQNFERMIKMKHVRDKFEEKLRREWEWAF